MGEGVYDDQGLAVRMIGICIDITERKRAEEALNESESLLRSFFNSPGVMRGIVEVIADDDVLHISDNEVAAGFLGLTPEQLRNKRGSELDEPQEVLSTWVSHYRQSQRTGKPVRFEYHDVRANNKSAWLSAIVSYLGTNQDGRPRFTYIVTDITDRKQAEESLQEANEELEVVAEELRQQNDELIRTQLELQESEDKYRELVQNANSII